MTELRMYQKEARSNIDEFLASQETAGRVIIPTGGGKTLVESLTLRKQINESERDVHIVLAPRIALVNQLIKEYRNFIGQNYIAVAFHSGRNEPDFERVRWAEYSTTNPQIIREELARARRLDKDLVVFSTYASAHKLTNIDFGTLIADESQYCVTEDYFDAITAIRADKKLFFTATEKHTLSEQGRGLNNTEVFGEVLYQIAPRELIKEGYIVAPRLHVMTANTKNKDNSAVTEALEIARKQAELAKDMPVTKILFAMKGTKDVKSIIENISRFKAELPNFRIFTIVSNTKYGSMVDGEKMARGNFMKELREEDNALIFHYDILSEGIDVDGITGVAILRNMKHSKLLQTIGRAVRVYKANPELKKQAWVSVTAINGDQDSMDNIARTLVAIREGGFDVNMENIVLTDSASYGIEEDGLDIDMLISPTRRNDVVAVLKGVMHDIEQDAIFEAYKTMSDEELIEIAKAKL